MPPRFATATLLDGGFHILPGDVRRRSPGKAGLQHRFFRFSAEAYAVGIDILLYAMTH